MVKNVNISTGKISFNQLVNSILQVHNELSAQASKAVNTSLTLRNWLIGLYIFEYEFNGRDRADYGKKVVESLSQRLSNMDIARTDVRELRVIANFMRLTLRLGSH